jgi:hypothetical protein
MFATDRLRLVSFLATGLWQHIYQIIVKRTLPPPETVVRAADDVRCLGIVQSQRLDGGNSRVYRQLMLARKQPDYTKLKIYPST